MERHDAAAGAGEGRGITTTTPFERVDGVWLLARRVIIIPFGGTPHTPMTPCRLRVCGVTAFAAVHRSTAAPKDDAEPDADR